MRVEDVQIGREVGAQPLVPLGSDIPCSLERLHRAESSAPPSRRVARGCVPTSCRLRKGHCRRCPGRGSKGASNLIPDRRLHEAHPRACSALVVSLAAASASGSGAGSVVVAEVFAAGGNSGAAYANDYVELFNRGASAVAVDGWTLQYASAAGTSWQSTALSGSIPAGGRFLVQLASGGANGAALPAPDASGTTNLAVTGGKVAVVDDATPLSCGASPGSCSAISAIEDLVGYGGAADYEGTGPSPAGSATTALARAGGGCTDSDDNAADFATAAPDPQNSSVPASACSAPPPPPNGTSAEGAVDVDVQPVLSIALDHATLSFPAAVP
ncbi:MAG TPA: lamin tail domain-containing protein, partial [Gaiellaceae bacterium]|nr:lamin tail domain-containing protein [Gaiellaceae bacterium]